jgi:hypothetical protein
MAARVFVGWGPPGAGGYLPARFLHTMKSRKKVRRPKRYHPPPNSAEGDAECWLAVDAIRQSAIAAGWPSRQAFAGRHAVAASWHVYQRGGGSVRSCIEVATVNDC